MSRKKGGLVLTVLIGLLAACGTEGKEASESKIDDGIAFSAKYVVKADSSRSAEVVVDGIYRPYSSMKTAAAGKADVLIKSTGTVTFKNLSDGRAIDSDALNHRIKLMLPFDACVLSPIYKSVVDDAGIEGGLTCSYEVLLIDSPDLQPSETATRDFTQVDSGDDGIVTRRATSVPEGDAKAWVRAARSAALVAGADERSDLADEKLNPVCIYEGRRGPVERATFWTSDKTITLCSTEPT